MAQFSYPLAAAPIAIVGPQYCSPYPVDLTVTHKLISVTNWDFAMKDAADNDVFRLKGVFFRLHYKRVMQDAAGVPIVTLQEKMLSPHHRWKVFQGGSTDDGNLLFSVKKCHLMQLKTTLDVFLAANKKGICDFKVKGSYFERSCTVFKGDSSVVVAQIKKQHRLTNMAFGTGSFGVTIYPHVDKAFIMILDEINQSQRAAASAAVSAANATVTTTATVAAAAATVL